MKLPKIRYNKTFLYYLSSFLLAVALFFLSVFGSLTIATFGENALNKFVSHQYALGVYNSTMDELAAYVKPCGFDDSVLENVVVFDNVKKHLEITLAAKLSSDDTVIDTAEMEESLVENVQHQSAEELTKEQTDAFVSGVIEQYKNAVSLKVIDDFLVLRTQSLKKIVAFAMPLVLLLCVAVFLLFKLNTYAHRACRYCYVSVFSASLAVFAIAVTLLVGKSHLYLQLAPLYFNNAIVSIINQTLVTLLASAITLFVLSLFLLVAVDMLKKRTIKKRGKK